MKAVSGLSPGEIKAEQGKATFPKISQDDKNPSKWIQVSSTVLWPAGNLSSKDELDHDKITLQEPPWNDLNQQSASPTSPLRALCHRYLNPVYPLQNCVHLPAKHWLHPSHTMCMWLSCHLWMSCPVQNKQLSATTADCVGQTAPLMVWSLLPRGPRDWRSLSRSPEHFGNTSLAATVSLQATSIPSVHRNDDSSSR